MDSIRHDVDSIENTFLDMLVKEFKGNKEGKLKPCYEFENSKQFCHNIDLHNGANSDCIFVVAKFKELHMIGVDSESAEKIYTADDWIRSFKELDNGTILIVGDFGKIIVLNPVYTGDNLEYVEGQSFNLNEIKFSDDAEFDPSADF